MLTAKFDVAIVLEFHSLIEPFAFILSSSVVILTGSPILRYPSLDLISIAANLGVAISTIGSFGVVITGRLEVNGINLFITSSGRPLALASSLNDTTLVLMTISLNY